jgi:hypothetical protein
VRTQFADTYQEANGALTADRQPKFPIEDIFAATTGVTARIADRSSAVDAASNAAGGFRTIGINQPVHHVPTLDDLGPTR